MKSTLIKSGGSLVRSKMAFKSVDKKRITPNLRQNTVKLLILEIRLVRPAGIEPTTPGFGNLYSIQLSYERTCVGHIIGKKHR